MEGPTCDSALQLVSCCIICSGITKRTDIHFVPLISLSVHSVTETVAVIVTCRVEGCSGALNAVAVCILSQPKHKSTLHLSVNGHTGTASTSIWKNIQATVWRERDLQTRNTFSCQPHCGNKLLQQHTQLIWRQMNI